MNIVEALIIAGIVIAVIVIFIIIFGRGLLDSYLLSLNEKNDQQRRKDKEEIGLSVKELLSGDRERFDLIVKQIKEQVSESREDAKALHKQHAVVAEQIRQVSTATEGLKMSTEGLKNLLSNNRLRGEWGEQVAEDLLLGAGFVENTNFLKQSTTEEGRPDFTILMPDGTKLNVDAKFPLDDLITYQEVETDKQRKEALRQFEKAVKHKVGQLTSKDYIDTSAQTVDFVVMFIPNEMVFSFIYEKLPVITDYAATKKVILTGPFGFTAMLRLVLQAYKNFGYEQGLTEILGLIEKFQNEYEKFGDALAKVGRQIDGVQNAFNEVEGTRQRQLSKVLDRINDYSMKNKEITAGKDDNKSS
jgi:DNA recombination protein RmuC